MLFYICIYFALVNFVWLLGFVKWAQFFVWNPRYFSSDKSCKKIAYFLVCQNCNFGSQVVVKTFLNISHGSMIWREKKRFETR